MNWKRVADVLEASAIRVDHSRAPHPVGGGDISAAWRLATSTGPVFLKTGEATAFTMFDAEACGLRELADASAIRVPGVLAVAEYEGGALLALEWLDLGSTTAGTDSLFGKQLAALHRRTRDQYGWYRDNTIGKTPQHNSYRHNWADFYREHRLDYQLRLAANNGFGGELQVLGARLLDNLDAYLDSHKPDASLLHGDLWGGNWSVVDGQPVIFDPAVYYGDRETDLAMTRLFGGFGPGFYEAYVENWPLPDGYERRVPLYQLYHVLNHLNLFGRGYLGRALALANDLLDT